MLPKTIIFIVFFLPVSHTFSQPLNCSSFREGKFRTADTRIGAVVVTDRKGNFQTESTEALKLILRFKITWQDNCSYTLKLDKVIRNENKVEVPGNLLVQVKIIETTARSYIQETTSSLLNGTYKVEVFKLY